MSGTAGGPPASAEPSGGLSLPLAAALLLLLAMQLPVLPALLLALLPLAWGFALRRPRLGLLCTAMLLHGAWVAWQQQAQRIAEPLLLESAEVQIVELRSASTRPRLKLMVEDSQGRRFRLSVWDEEVFPRVGECWQMRLRLRPPMGLRNFHGFDYGRWLWAEGVHGSGSASNLRPCAGTHAGHPYTPSAQSPYPIGAALRAALGRADREGFSPRIWEVLARSGTSHLFAISGLHVGLIGLWAAWLGRGLWGWSGLLQQRIVRRRWMLLCAALAVCLYTAMAWEQVSARRAGGMALAGMALLWAGRPFSPLSLLGLALVGILLLQPLAIFHPALSLSFGACVFLLLALPQLQARPWWQQWLLIQLLLGLGLAPVVVAWFGQWSLIGLGLNLLLVPAMVLLLPLVLLAEFLSLWGWGLPRLGTDAGLEGLFLLLEAFSSPSWAVLYLPQGRWLWALGGCLGLAWALHRGGRQGLLIAALALPVCAAALRPFPAVPAGQARLSVLDVGQGQALIVETATQVAVLDTGPARKGGLDAGQMILLPHLRQRGWKAIDLLVLSHAHSDHSGGAAALAEAMPIHQRWGHAGQSCDQPRSWAADGVRIHSLARDYSRPWSENDRSCVLIVEAGAARLLVPGDVEAAAEAALSEAVGRRGPYAAALVAHHGSRSSSTEAWVQAVAAPLAIVSAGAYNRWGFPAPEVLQRWQQQGAEVLQTGEGGAVEILLPSMEWRRPNCRPNCPEPL